MIKIHFNNGTDRQYTDVIYLVIEGDRQIFFFPYLNGLSKIAIDKSVLHMSVYVCGSVCVCVYVYTCVSRGARNVFLIIYNLNS